MTLVTRAAAAPGAMTAAVRGESRALHPDLPASDLRTMARGMSYAGSPARFNTLLLAIFAGLATVLAAVGIFGVMNYSVTLRTGEIGIRMALGARPVQVLMLIMKQGLLLMLAGLGIGLAGALALTRVMS